MSILNPLKTRHLSIGLLGLGLMGCELPNGGPVTRESQVSLPGSCHIERFVRPVAKPVTSVDLLFVTDTSGSLDTERAKIANGIDGFVAQLPKGLDYQIAVMLGHGSTSPHNGRLYKYKNNPYVLSSKEMSLSQIRKSLVANLTSTAGDYYSDGGEEGLYSVMRAMDKGPYTSSQAHGFFRNDAALAIVFIADENDICAIYPSGVKPVADGDNIEAGAKKRDCAGITPESVYARIKEVRGNTPLIISGILYSDLKTVPKGDENEFGYGYMELINLAGGVAVDIAKGNYEAGLSQIGKLTVDSIGATLDFKLGRSPINPSTLSVTLSDGTDTCKKDDHKGHSHDGREVDFTYNAQLNQVHILDENASEPIVDIRYCMMPASPSPSPTASSSPTPSPSVTASPSPSPSATVSPSPSPSPSPSVTVTPSPSPTVSASPSPSPTVTPSPTPSVTVTPSPSPSPSASPSPTGTPCTGPFCGGGIVGT